MFPIACLEVAICSDQDDLFKSDFIPRKEILKS